MSRTVLLIANPAAGFRRTDTRAEEAARRLEGLGFRPELYRTTGMGDGERAARAAAGAFDVVIAAGGDGTVHEAANGLAGTATPLGIIPLGSMNILARELGTPLDVAGACAWVARAEAAPVTMGRRDGRHFVIMAGIGYDAFVLEEALRRAKAGGRKVGFLDYVVAATLGARSYPFPRLLIESRDWSGTGAFAIVANCARYGANMRMAPRARLDDPALELVVMPEGRFVERVRYLVAILAGTLEGIPGVVMRRVEEVSIRAGDGGGTPCQLDGEVAPAPAGRHPGGPRGAAPAPHGARPMS